MTAPDWPAMTNPFVPRHAPWPATGTAAPFSARGEALLQHWHACRGERLVPTRNEFNPLNLRPWLGSITILTMIDGGKDFLVRLDGTDVVALTGEDWTGRLVSEIDAAFGSHVGDDLRAVIDSASPSIRRMPILQKSWQSATRVCLPVSSGDGQSADQVFKGMFLDH